MSCKPIDELIKTCENSLKDLDFKESTIKRHKSCFLRLKDYMRLNGLDLYDEVVGERYQINMLTVGTTTDYRLKCTGHSINILNDFLNHKLLRKKG